MNLRQPNLSESSSEDADEAIGETKPSRRFALWDDAGCTGVAGHRLRLGSLLLD